MVAKSVTEMVGKLRLNVRMEVGAFLVCIPTIQLQNCIYKLEGIKQTKITIFGQWLWLKADSHELHAAAADGCVAAAEIGKDENKEKEAENGQFKKRFLVSGCDSVDS